MCARGDLESVDAVPSGCFDTKVTSYDMALRMQVDAVAGPTTEVRSQHCPTKKTADCAWFNGPASQAAEGHVYAPWPQAVGCHTHIYIYTCYSTPSYHSPVQLLGCQCCGQAWECMAHCRHSKLEEAMASLPEGLILPAKTAAVPGHDLMCLSCREGCRLLNGRSHS